MNSENLRPTLASNDSGPMKTTTINLDDLRSMPLLLRLLEKQLDRHIDDNEYV